MNSTPNPSNPDWHECSPAGPESRSLPPAAKPQNAPAGPSASIHQKKLEFQHGRYFTAGICKGKSSPYVVLQGATKIRDRIYDHGRIPLPIAGIRGIRQLLERYWEAFFKGRKIRIMDLPDASRKREWIARKESPLFHHRDKANNENVMVLCYQSLKPTNPQLPNEITVYKGELAQLNDFLAFTRKSCRPLPIRIS